MTLKQLLLAALAIETVIYVGAWLFEAARRTHRMSGGAAARWLPASFNASVGFVTNFFDTLGIGSFAPTTSIFKFQRAGGLWGALRERTPNYVLFGAITGAFVGYWSRPAATPTGGLPFAAVISRGASLTDAEAALRGAAISSFNLLVGLAVAGALVGWVAAKLMNRRSASTLSASMVANVPDEHIPGTLNVGHTMPTVVQAFIFVTLVQVELRTLVFLIAAAVAGAWLGAGIVASWPRRRIQIGMGIALLVAAGLFTIKNLNWLPGGGTADALHGQLLVAGVIGNFALGALMTLGIGLYAPCMILVSLLGMSPTTAFPIMMGSCAFLMPVASLRFVRKDSYNLRAALGLTLGGIPAVLLAALIVQSLPLVWVRWLVVLVVAYAATAMLRSALAESGARATVGARSRGVAQP
jgi:uncharacterized membrane protein YfcA